MLSGVPWALSGAERGAYCQWLCGYCQGHCGHCQAHLSAVLWVLSGVLRGTVRGTVGLPGVLSAVLWVLSRALCVYCGRSQGCGGHCQRHCGCCQGCWQGYCQRYCGYCQGYPVGTVGTVSGTMGGVLWVLSPVLRVDTGGSGGAVRIPWLLSVALRVLSGKRCGYCQGECGTVSGTAARGTVGVVRQHCGHCPRFFGKHCERQSGGGTVGTVSGPV